MSSRFFVRPVAQILVWIVGFAVASRSGNPSDNERLDLDAAGRIVCQGDGDSVLYAAGSECRVRPNTIEEVRFVNVEYVFRIVRSKDPLPLAPPGRDRNHIYAVGIAFITLPLDPVSLFEALEPTSGVREVYDVELFPKECGLSICT